MHPPLADRIRAAEVCLPSGDLNADVAFFVDRLGFKLDTIFPADDPSIATLSGHGLALRLDRNATTAPPTLRLIVDAGTELQEADAGPLTAPNGVKVDIVAARSGPEIPPTVHAFVVRRLKDQAPWVIGRAGMHYRDLIPGRLGGSIIASHIRVPDAGPVPDMVHYHTVGFQLIFCYHGWVRLVYEDQGPPFVLTAGDCVIQPPQIRHRVLESSEDLQVIEIGVPAEHVTTVDHAMTLPTAQYRPERIFGGQTFCRSQAIDAVWGPWRISGFEARDTGIATATAGVASVQVVRPIESIDPASVGTAPVTSHTADIHFTFVLSGRVTLHAEGYGLQSLSEGDAYVTPPNLKTALTQATADLQLLEVSLPAVFETRTFPNVELLLDDERGEHVVVPRPDRSL